jgi:hypothetical protein
MGDREARILGAGDKITVGDKEYTLRPVVAKHLCDLQRDALAYHKRQYLTTFRDNADLLSNGRGNTLLEQKMEEAARWTLEDLPQRDAFDTSRIPITQEVKNWIKEKYEEIPTEDCPICSGDSKDGKSECEACKGKGIIDSDDTIRVLLVTALDQGTIKRREVKKLTGKNPVQGRVRYDQWWITACMEGMISFVVTSIQMEHENVTKKDIQKWSFTKIAEAARKVENISRPEMENI